MNYRDTWVGVFERLLNQAHINIQSLRTPIGTTPKTEIWGHNKSRLYRYDQTATIIHKTPIFLSMPLINQDAILDLHPGNSFVEYLIGQGFDVWLYRWGEWGPEDRHLALSDVIQHYLYQAMIEVADVTKKSLTVVGYCIGGTFAAIVAALHSQEALIKNLVTFTTPIDFKEAGGFGVWTRREFFPLQRLGRVLPIVPGVMIDIGSKLLNPLVNTLGAQVRLSRSLESDQYDADAWMRMNQWVQRGTPFPIGVYHEWIQKFYQQNELARGLLRINERIVDLRNIQIPLYIVTASADTIAPRPTTAALAELVSSSDLIEDEVRGGHVGAIIAGKFWPRLAKWCALHD